eukprot:m.82309 g.82309  ORF g.82309 m.82309 type:complete len:54 (-) comp8665_c4_seq1:2313-2474(-)
MINHPPPPFLDNNFDGIQQEDTYTTVFTTKTHFFSWGKKKIIWSTFNDNQLNT